MGRSAESVCIVIVLTGFAVAAIAWTGTRPDATIWACRLGGILVMLLAIGAILYLRFRPDLIHDYLREVSSRYFNRDGFCFTFKAEAIKGIACMTVYFQNQYSRPCIGKIALRPALGFFMNRAPIKSINYIIQCEPAAFGVARIALPLSNDLQGKKQSFDVGASVFYLKGKGRRLRFRNGIFLRANEKFGNSFSTGVMVAAAATGHVITTGLLFLDKPAKATVSLPEDVAEQLPGEMRMAVKTLWRLNDPPLKTIAAKS